MAPVTADTVTLIVTVAVGAVVVLGGIYALFRFVFLAQLSRRIDTAMYLLSHHRHTESGTVLAPIKGAADGDD